MAVKTTAQLKAFLTANININGVSAITGALLNTMLEDMIDSLLNRISDVTDLATKIYRSNIVSITTSTTQVTFSSSIGTTSYQALILDPNGVGFEAPFDLQETGFKIKGLTNGDIIYLIILNN